MMQIVFTDGLGNQMFQYALYLAMRKRGRRPLLNTGIITRNIVHNGFELCRDFQIDRRALRCVDGGWLGGGITIFLLRYVKGLCWHEDVSRYDPAVFDTHKPIVCGYWQNVRYFEDVADEVRQAFTFRNIDDSNRLLGDEMAQCQSVAIHIRRGDYLKHPEFMVCTPRYYDSAIAYVRQHVAFPVFYVFSDDLEWSETFMKERGVQYRLVGHNRGQDSYKDMYLMSRCHHNIIANSSFSWWGAWLNASRDQIVVCPDVWVKASPVFSPQLQEWVRIGV